jgi:hypothetical protein
MKTVKTLSLCFFMIVTFGFALKASADLEWITGGVPKSSSDKSETTVIRDAPMAEGSAETAGKQDVVLGLVTTCTKFTNQYPADSVNYFFLNKNDRVCYFAYFLMKPSSRIHTATVECYSPSNTLIAKHTQEYRVSFVDRLLTVHNETYQWYLMQMTVGIDHMNPENGQMGLPRSPGLYSIHLSVNGQIVAISFFYIREPESKAPAPVPTISSMQTAPAAAAEAASILNKRSIPMSTPGPISPIQNIIP